MESSTTFAQSAAPMETPPWPYAGFWRRVAATVIDQLILIVPVVLLSMFTFGAGGVAAVLIYGAYFESSEHRATLGKQACGLTVETMNGEKLTFGTALLRNFLKLLGNLLSVLTWLIFFVPAAFTAHKQGLHDMAVSSVVRREPGKGIPSWLVGVIAGVIPLVFVGGILAAIAIPAYQDYVSRAKIAGARQEAAPLRAAVEAAYAKNGKLPLDQSELVVSGDVVRETRAYRNGRIEISLSVGSRQGQLFLTPTGNADRVIWQCSAENIPRPQLPNDCR